MKWFANPARGAWFKPRQTPDDVDFTKDYSKPDSMAQVSGQTAHRTRLALQPA